MQFLKDYQVLIGSLILGVMIGGSILTAADRISDRLRDINTHLIGTRDVRINGTVRTSPS